MDGAGVIGLAAGGVVEHNLQRGHLAEQAAEEVCHIVAPPALVGQFGCDTREQDGTAEVDALAAHVGVEVAALLIGDVEGDAALNAERLWVSEGGEEAEVVVHHLLAEATGRDGVREEKPCVEVLVEAAANGCSEGEEGEEEGVGGGAHVDDDIVACAAHRTPHLRDVSGEVVELFV